MSDSARLAEPAGSGPVIVAGAGIGGLAAAVALGRIGKKVLVLERAKTIDEVGAGIQISPNASCILRDFGVLEALQGQAVYPDSIVIRRGRDGARLANVSLKNAEKRWGAPYFTIHRADLQKALLEQAQKNPLIEIRTDTSLAGFVDDRGSVSIGAKSGANTLRFEGEALIGADGLRSIVRDRLTLGDADKPAYTGHTAWRTTIAAEFAPTLFRAPVSNLWMGSKAHLVHYPLRGGALINVVAIVEDAWKGDGEEDVWRMKGDAAFLAKRFDGWSAQARELLALAPQWLRWPMFDRTPI